MIPDLDKLNSKAYTDEKVKASYTTGEILDFSSPVDLFIGFPTAINSTLVIAGTVGVPGRVILVKHNSASALTLPSECKLLSGEYATSVDNYISFMFVANSEILVTINQVL